MLRFTEEETRILKKYISDRELCNSLALIRRLMENIWAADAPRILGYPDHGEEHSVRVACFAEKLLQVNPGAEFSEHEIYLLLAGIYLHDIGMQCDIVRYPEVKKKAESLGAMFKVEFTSKAASVYSQEVQIEIRKNYHYLSAGWIDYLYEKNDYAIKSIPYDLVDDLIDICKFHSKLPIIDCPDLFNHNPSNRKKLIAALLRFADELDISIGYTNIEAAKIFSMYEYNRWLQSYTTVSFTGSNKVLMKMRLHPEDFKLYGSFLRDKFINGFKDANEPVLDVLAEEGIPIIIDTKSGVELHKRVEKFPLEISTLFNEMIQKIESDGTSRRCDVAKTTNPLTEARTKDGDMPRAVIFTALPVEYKAVRDHLKCLEEKLHSQGTIYERGIFSSNDQEWDVGIAEIGQGNEQTALEVERAIQYFNPNIILFVGVAGGIKDVKLGDVVVASKVYGYELGKAGDTFQPRPEVGSPDYKLISRAKAEARKDDWLRRLSELVPNSNPNVFIKPIAAGGKLLNSTRSAVYKFIKSNYGDTLAIEMEGYGFLKAAYANPQVDALVIRGISDLIDEKEKADKAGFQEIASCNASAFAFEILAKTYFEPIYLEQPKIPDKLSHGSTTDCDEKIQNMKTYEISGINGIPKPSISSSEGNKIMSSFEYDVFICHSSMDKPVIAALIEDFKKENITYWIDAEQINFGHFVTQKIEDGLKNSRYVIPCLSKNLSTSGWSRAEYSSILNAEFSGNSERIVIPLKLDNCEESDIPLLLNDKKRVTYSNKTEFKEFVEFLRSKNVESHETIDSYRKVKRITSKEKEHESIIKTVNLGEIQSKGEKQEIIERLKEFYYPLCECLNYRIRTNSEDWNSFRSELKRLSNFQYLAGHEIKDGYANLKSQVSFHSLNDGEDIIRFDSLRIELLKLVERDIDRLEKKIRIKD